MTTNNTYLKTIAEKVTETEISGTHTDNYYLKLICTTYGYIYTGTVCDGKLIKDFASAVTSKTYNRIHFDNKYYHDIAESLTGNTYDNKYDNFYLGIIAENITPPTPIKILDHIGVELIAGNQILSYADEQQTPDSQYATVRFTAYDVDNNVIPNLALDFQVGSGAVTSVVTDANGRYEYTYHSQGVGDVEIVASKTVEGILVSKTYGVQDCYRYDNASSDKTSSYGSLIAYRGGGSGTWNYNSTNGYYGTITGSNECMVELSELTGKDDFTIEFDASLNANVSGVWGIAGICAYENNDNYSRLSCHGKKIAQRVSVNGSANESDSDVLTTVRRYDILHYKFTISNNQIIEEVTRGTTLIGTRTISYTPTSNTKYGIALIWSNDWVKDTFIKNIKTKPL